MTAKVKYFTDQDKAANFIADVYNRGGEVKHVIHMGQGHTFEAYIIYEEAASFGQRVFRRW